MSSSSSSSSQPPEPCDHEISPNGDVVLVLNNANAPFAVWDDVDAAASPSTSASKQIESPLPASAITFLVSSHHLKSASPVFNAALTRPWSESALTSHGRHRITAEDWDVEALLIVLNAVHGRNNRVPMTVTLEILCKVSVVVDYYRVHEAVRFSSLLWINGLRAWVPETYCRELVLWLCISWVFQDDSIFKEVTKTAILKSPESLSALQLPISAAVIDQIQKQKKMAILVLSAFLERLKAGFLDGTQGCSFECQSIMLGGLVKNMVAHGIQENIRNPRYFRRIQTVEKAVQAVEAIKPLDIEWRGHMNGKYHSCRFSLSDTTKSYAKHAMDTYAQPLELKEFNHAAAKTTMRA